MEFFCNTLARHLFKWLLVCVHCRNGTGVFISDVVKGGAAELDGRLMQGDQILSVDGDDMRQASQETVAAILKVRGGARPIGSMSHQQTIT